MTTVRVNSVRDVATEIIASTGDAVIDDVESLRKELDAAIRKINRRFFQTLASMGTNVPGPPSLDQFTPTWDPLNAKYLRYKQRKTGNTNFFTFTGKLQSTLSRMKAETVFGTPWIDVQNRRATGNPHVRYTEFMNRGKMISRGRMIAGPRKGQFARPEDILRYVPGKISVTPFPSQYYGDEEFVFRDRPEIEYKLRQRRAPHRPLLGPFMDWWIETKLKNVVQTISRGALR